MAHADVGLGITRGGADYELPFGASRVSAALRKFSGRIASTASGPGSLQDIVQKSWKAVVGEQRRAADSRCVGGRNSSTGVRYEV
jgi:hypothetical protein